MTNHASKDVTVAPLDGWELIAAGDERKLERFGDFTVERPAPQAIWDSPIPFEGADAIFKRNKDGSGKWIEHAPTRPIRAAIGHLTFEIRLTGFGNVGLFPEHCAHWDWMTQRLEKRSAPTVLNLFAYTGGASLVCARAGARVTHVDAAKSVNSWAEHNSRLSKIEGGSIRYITDDAIKFVKREVRRGRHYHGMILDPPTFGRGPKGETWKIERDFSELLKISAKLLHDDATFILLTSHSPGVTPAVLRALLHPLGGTVTCGEMLLDGRGPSLPAGAYARWIPH